MSARQRLGVKQRAGYRRLEDMKPSYRWYHLKVYAKSFYETYGGNQGEGNFIVFLMKSLERFEKNEKKAMDPQSVAYNSSGLITRIDGIEAVGSKIEIDNIFYEKISGKRYKTKYLQFKRD